MDNQTKLESLRELVNRINIIAFITVIAVVVSAFAIKKIMEKRSKVKEEKAKKMQIEAKAEKTKVKAKALKEKVRKVKKNK